MKRLREEVDSQDPLVCKAAQLLTEVAPLEQSDLRRQRVWRAVNTIPTRRRLATSWLALALTLLVGTAAALVVNAQWSNTNESAPSTTDNSASSKETASARSSKKEALPTEAIVPQADEIGIIGAEQSAKAMVDQSREDSSQEVTPPSPRQPPSIAPPKASKASSAQRISLSDVRLMQQAVEELRGKGDPEKAEALIEMYRNSSSTSQLEEESLAISIEAAIATKNPKRASYAREYLAKYPGGRFASLARRALSVDEPSLQ